MTRDGMVVLMTLFMAVASVMLMWGVPLRPTCRLQAAKVLFTRRVPFDPDRHVLDAKEGTAVIAWLDENTTK